jgi:hypothetical protein
MDKEKFISKMLCLPPTAIEYHISQRLAKFFPAKALIEGDTPFDMEEYANGYAYAMEKKQKPSALTVRFTEEEKAIITALRAYYGLNSDNEVLRFALRAAAREMQQLRAKAKDA